MIPITTTTTTTTTTATAKTAKTLKELNQVVHDFTGKRTTTNTHSNFISPVVQTQEVTTTSSSITSTTTTATTTTFNSVVSLSNLSNRNTASAVTNSLSSSSSSSQSPSSKRRVVSTLLGRLVGGCSSSGSRSQRQQQSVVAPYKRSSKKQKRVTRNKRVKEGSVLRDKGRKTKMEDSTNENPGSYIEQLDVDENDNNDQKNVGTSNNYNHEGTSSNDYSDSDDDCYDEGMRNLLDASKNYLPEYLNSLVSPYRGEFWWSPLFHPTLIGQLMMEGFLPIAGPNYLLPKLHEHRCVIPISKVFDNNINRLVRPFIKKIEQKHSPKEQQKQKQQQATNGTDKSRMLYKCFHMSKSSKKKANRYRITINQSFDDVIAGCHKQHGSSCWLYPQLVAAFRTIHEQSKTNNVDHEGASSSMTPPYFQTKIYPTTTSSINSNTNMSYGTLSTRYNNTDNASSKQNKQKYRRKRDENGSGSDSNNNKTSSPTVTNANTSSICHLRLYSIEVWNIETNMLVAGELGYTVGSIYTSLTGFTNEDSAGSVQLSALGCLLQLNGFTLWDLGMEMDYKQNLGAILLPRPNFVPYVHYVRSNEIYNNLYLSTNSTSTTASKSSTVSSSSSSSSQLSNQASMTSDEVNITLGRNCKEIIQQATAGM